MVERVRERGGRETDGGREGGREIHRERQRGTMFYTLTAFGLIID